MIRVVLLASALLLALPLKQESNHRFVLNDTKPYAFLQFDHTGPRKPIQAGETTQGLWLKIVNNCEVPISVKTYGSTPGDPEVSVLDEVIPVQGGFSVLEDAEQASGSERNLHALMPHGYSTEVSPLARILPGTSLLFSVPRNHVGLNWFLRVKVTLDVSQPSAGLGPWTQLDFFNGQIPPKSN
jgi:hypothetical protein